MGGEESATKLIVGYDACDAPSSPAPPTDRRDRARGLAAGLFLGALGALVLVSVIEPSRTKSVQLKKELVNRRGEPLGTLLPALACYQRVEKCASVPESQCYYGAACVHTTTAVYPCVWEGGACRAAGSHREGAIECDKRMQEILVTHVPSCPKCEAGADDKKMQLITAYMCLP